METGNGGRTTPRPALLTLEQYARIAARIDAGVPKDEALRDAGVTAEAWDASQAAWLARIADNASNGRLGLSQRYAELFAKHRDEALRRKRKERKPLEGPLPEPPLLVRPPMIVADQLVRARRSVHAPPPSAPYFSAPPSSGSLPPPAPSSRRLPLAASPPAPPVAAPSAPALTVEQYASLRAELVTAPELHHAEIRARYNLDESAWPAEERTWRERMAADPALFKRFTQHFQYMRGLLTPR